ncbi:GumC family protein [Rhizobium sp. L1K21]|uniref:GumC family protein n=1 Tax=Rhizobium sp. L1K21 TaxID=2954933 RepID=UPI002091F8A9|nr:Wzz/FepE/Etk N-terminal domain-containing protein [Rhizobium sp. L1K21]MCO6185842.1 Wzz/FepE/Etk N-terminal domain-containing protein [Rhizobium sp. L1K21]
MSGVNSSQDVDIDLGRLFGALWEKRLRIGIVTAGVAGLAFLATGLMSPEYKSEAQILIELRQPEYSAGGQVQGGGSDPVLDELGISSQVQLLQSVDLIKQVAREMKLYELEEFDPDAHPSLLKTLAISAGLVKNPLDVAPEERVLNEFREKLQVYQISNSRVIGVQFTSEDPKLAAAIPNKIAEVYFSLQSGAKLDTNTEAARWLEPEIANLREKVREAEAKVAAYRASSDLLRTGTDQTFAGQQLNDISGEITRLRGEKADAEAKAQSVRSALASGGNVDTIADVVASPMIQRLKEQESNIQAQISDLSTSLLEGHPRLKGLRGQLSSVQAQLQSETKKILLSLENDAKVAGLREQQLLQQLNTLKADSARADEEEVGLNALEREAAAHRQLLETYLSRYREAASRVGSDATPADARLVSRAVEPQNVNFPKKIPITIIAALATFLIYSVIIMLGELFSGRAWKTEGEVAHANDAMSAPRPVRRPAAASAEAMGDDEGDMEPVHTVSASESASAPARLSSAVRSAAERLVSRTPTTEDKGSADNETVSRPALIADPEEDRAFSAAAVARHMAEALVPVAICVSPSGDKGSALTVELARRIADKGLHTLLVDMTGTGYPSKLMTPSAKLAGISNILAGTAQIAASIHPDMYSAAHIIPRGYADMEQAMRAADRLPMIVDALSEAYDCVIIECGPAEARGIDRLSRHPQTELILTAPDESEAEIATIMSGFSAAGYNEVILVAGAPESASPKGRGRRWKVA